MKYEVIGWTHAGNGIYPAHERYCPLLNDGTYVSYSWRGWGRIIALAYDLEGEYAYIHAYMNNMIKPEARKYPDSMPDDNRIAPKEREKLSFRDSYL